MSSVHAYNADEYLKLDSILDSSKAVSTTLTASSSTNTPVLSSTLTSQVDRFKRGEVATTNQLPSSYVLTTSTEAASTCSNRKEQKVTPMPAITSPKIRQCVPTMKMKSGIMDLEKSPIPNVVGLIKKAIEDSIEHEKRITEWVDKNHSMDHVLSPVLDMVDKLLKVVNLLSPEITYQDAVDSIVDAYNEKYVNSLAKECNNDDKSEIPWDHQKPYIVEKDYETSSWVDIKIGTRAYARINSGMVEICYLSSDGKRMIATLSSDHFKLYFRAISPIDNLPKI